MKRAISVLAACTLAACAALPKLDAAPEVLAKARLVCERDPDVLEAAEAMGMKPDELCRDVRVLEPFVKALEAAKKEVKP